MLTLSPLRRLFARLREQPLLPSLAALMAGVMVTLSLAPLDWWPAGFLAIALLLWAHRESRSAFFCGWIFGLGLYGSGASWIYVSMYYHGDTSLPLSALLTMIFCAGLALVAGLQLLVYRRYLHTGITGADALIGFPVLWVLFEWVRSWILTGFPWLYLGYAHVETPLSTWAPVLGVYGLSLFTAIIGGGLYLLVIGKGKERLAAAIAIVLPFLLALPLGQAQWVELDKRPIGVGLVQANIPQDKKWDRDFLHPTLSRYTEMTAELWDRDIVLWPESAIPIDYYRAEPFIAQMDQIAAERGVAIISGIPYWEYDDDRIHNSITVFGNGNGLYHKQKLVPFGEYIPLQSLIRGLIPFFDLPMSSFSKGPADQGLLLAGDDWKIAPYICYEVVYPDFARRNMADADLLLTISNDTWFGDSFGPLQHLQMAQMRALENQRYMIRGTNNGVTAIIDHRGRVSARLDQFVQDSLVGEVFIARGQTPFNRLGSSPLLLLSAVLCATLLAMARRRRTQA